jgi:hypothetical protein
MAALRAGDGRAAAKAVIDSRKLHAKWRGYPYAGPDATSLTLPSSLLVSGINQPNEVAAAMAANAADLLPAGRVGRVVAALTYEDELVWPDLSTWSGYFARVSYRPAMWSDPLLQPEPRLTPDDARLGELWTSLTPDELRVVAIDAGDTLRLDWLAEHSCLSLPDARSLVARLGDRGLAVFPAAPAEHLAAAKSADELRVLAAELGVVAKGRKLAMSQAITKVTTSGQVSALAPGEYVTIAPFPETPRWRYRVAFADVLAHALQLGGLRQARDWAAGSDVIRGYELSLTDKCPACAVYQGKVMSAKEAAALPMFLVHPGCRCTLVPIVKGMGEARGR